MAGASALGHHPLYRRSRFAPYLNTVFRTRSKAGAPVALKLEEIGELPSRSLDREREDSFSLIFRGTGRGALPQGLYTLSHAGIGSFQLFLVPMGRRKQARLYEAIVNRFQP